MNWRQFWFLLAVGCVLLFLAFVTHAAGFINDVGALMSPNANGNGGEVPVSPFAIVTETGVPIVTEVTESVLVTEDAP